MSKGKNWCGRDGAEASVKYISKKTKETILGDFAQGAVMEKDSAFHDGDSQVHKD